MESVLIDVAKLNGSLLIESAVASLVRESGGAWQGDLLADEDAGLRFGETYRVRAADGRSGEVVADRIEWESPGLIRVRFRGLGRFRRANRRMEPAVALS